MITFYVPARPFINDWAEIQERTLENLLSFKGVRVILMGNEETAEQAAHRFNLTYYGLKTYDGYSLCNEALIAARILSQDRFLARYSCDCLLPPEFQDIIYWLQDKQNLMLSCKRFDMTPESEFPHNIRGELARRDAVDIHIFDGDFLDMPPLKLGWGGDDGWLCKKGAERSRYVEIDMQIYHQEHSRDFHRAVGIPTYDRQLYFLGLDGYGSLDDARYILSGGVLREKSLPS